MRILIGLGHPAHFHLFKNVIINFKKKKIDFKIVIKDKDVLSSLLKGYNLDYYILKSIKTSNSLTGKANNILNSSFELIKDYKNFRPTLYIGCLSQLAYAGFLKRTPSLFFAEDDFKITYLQGISVYPFVNRIIAPDVTSVGAFEFKRTSYNGYHELAYLHPNHFIPSKSIAEKYISTSTPFYILRFAKLNAYHDIGVKGINTSIANKLIQLLQPHGNVYITSEVELDNQLEKFRIAINPIDMHHVMAFASLFIGDSQTMAAEAGVLGIPFIRYNDFVGKIGYLNDLENKYELGFGIKPGNEEELFNKVKILLAQDNLKPIWEKKRDLMLSEKIDVTKFFIWLIENFPKSIRTIKSNPNFLKTFS